MAFPGFFGFGLDLFPHWEGFVGALLPLLVVLLFFAKDCLKDESCQAVAATEEVQDSMSETEYSERLGARTVSNKEKGPSSGFKKIRMGEKTDLQGRKISGTNNKKKGKDSSLYPLQELEALQIESDHESEHESSGSGEEVEELNIEEEAELTSGRAMRSSQRAHPPPYELRPRPTAPSAPPYEEHLGPKTFSFIPDKVKRKLHLAFPVYEGENGRVYAPVEYNQIKELAESVRKYGVTANFTLAQLDRLALSAMTPADWETVAKASLVSMGQYLEWKALWHEAAQEQARANAQALTPEQQQWTFDLLTGQGRFTAAQIDYPYDAYRQIANTAIRAWKALSKKGEGSTPLTKIIQGTQEPFSDFVARMTEAAGRIFGDTDMATPLIEQLIFEQATQECRAAIAPRKNKGLQDWLRVCRELGGPLTNAGLAAAIMQSQKHPFKGPDRRVCFKCGKPGHLKKDCRSSEKERAPSTLCSRCGTGYHRAELCRSVRDVHGKILPPLGNPQTDPKNGVMGPRSQGPQKYGNKFIRAMTKEPSEAEQEWTCVPPPTSC